MHELTRQDARRIAVRAQLLDSPRPTDVLQVVRHLTLLQADLTAHVAPSADLVLWSRLGSTYAPEELRAALAGRALVELDGMVRPAEDVALHRAGMAAWPSDSPALAHAVDWLAANDACRLDVLARLRAEGPLSAQELPDTCVVPWRSSGWNAGRNVRRMLDVLTARGEVAVSGSRGRERLWDLAERVYPDEPVVPLEQARLQRDALRLTALGIARARSPVTPNEPDDVGTAGEPAVVEGVKGEWRVDPALLSGTSTGRTALLSPLDRLVFDRRRMGELWGFDYQLEMYKPAAQRRWGYWALPVLSGDRLVGKVDAHADRKAGVLRVHAVHEDVAFDRATAAGVDAELEDLAVWLELELLRAS